MGAGRGRAEVQLGTDLVVAHALPDQGKHLPFALCQHGQSVLAVPGCDPRGRDLSDQASGDPRREERFSGCDHPDGMQKLRRAAVLEEEATGAGLECVEDVVIGLVGGQDQDSYLLKPCCRGDLAGGLDPVEHRHPDVHEYDVGAGGPRLLDGLGAGGGLAHHLDVVLDIDQDFEPGRTSPSSSARSTRIGAAGGDAAVGVLTGSADPVGASGSRALTSNPPSGLCPANRSPPSSWQRSRIPRIPRPASAGLPKPLTADVWPAWCRPERPSHGSGRPPSSVTRSSTASAAVVEGHGDPGRASVSDHVGDRLLQDAVHGATDGARYLHRGRDNLERDVKAGIASLDGEFVDLPEAGLWDRLIVAVPEDPEDGSHLLQRLGAGLLDGLEGLARPFGSLVEDVRSDTGLDVDDCDGVGDGVVDLAGDPEPFLVHPRPGLLSRVRSARSARSTASTAMNRRDRTLSPRAALITEAPIRKKTQPMAARGSTSFPTTTQHEARTAIPTPAITSDRRPSPWAVTV